jgi:hypothetical protein
MDTKDIRAIMEKAADEFNPETKVGDDEFDELMNSIIQIEKTFKHSGNEKRKIEKITEEINKFIKLEEEN